MESKTCTEFKLKKTIEDFYKNYTECKDCSIKKKLKTLRRE